MKAFQYAIVQAVKMFEAAVEVFKAAVEVSKLLSRCSRPPSRCRGCCQGVRQPSRR
jgi:hypothetical protein